MVRVTVQMVYHVLAGFIGLVVRGRSAPLS